MNQRNVVLLWVWVSICCISCQGFVQYIPPSIAGVMGYCTMNPHNCVRSGVSAINNANMAIDWMEERHKQQVQQDERHKQQAQQEQTSKYDRIRIQLDMDLRGPRGDILLDPLLRMRH